MSRLPVMPTPIQSVYYRVNMLYYLGNMSFHIVDIDASLSDIFNLKLIKSIHAEAMNMEDHKVSKVHTAFQRKSSVERGKSILTSRSPETVDPECKIC